MNIVTRSPIGNHAEHNPPSWWVKWEPDMSWMSKHGFKGTGSVQFADKTVGRNWNITIGVGVPSSHISIVVEPNAGGWWAMHEIPGCNITNETLWWASIIALEALKRHPDWINPKGQQCQPATLPS
jgi:hypothetical protein